MNSKNQFDNNLNINKRKKFFHGLFTNPKYIVFNYTFWISIFLTLFVWINNRFLNEKNIIKTSAFYFMNKNSISIIGISIITICLILIVTVLSISIFNKEQLRKIVTSNYHTFEQFIFPYRYSAFLFMILCLITMFNQVIQIDVWLFNFVFYFWIFVMFYAFLYPMYLISEFISYVMLLAKIDKLNKE